MEAPQLLSPNPASDTEEQPLEESEKLIETDSLIANGSLPRNQIVEPFLRNSLDTATKLLKSEAKLNTTEPVEHSSELMAELQVRSHKSYFKACRCSSAR